MKKLLLLSFLAIILICGTSVAQYVVGDTVSDFTLPDSGGNMVSLYDYSDNIVFCYFWKST